jgi:hypothetical protein
MQIVNDQNRKRRRRKDGEGDMWLRYNCDSNCYIGKRLMKTYGGSTLRACQCGTIPCPTHGPINDPTKSYANQFFTWIGWIGYLSPI